MGRDQLSRTRNRMEYNIKIGHLHVAMIYAGLDEVDLWLRN